MKKKKVYIYIIHRTVFHANMKSYPVQYERQHKSFTHIEHHIGVAGRLHSSLLRIYFPGFTVLIPIHTAKKSAKNLSDMWRSRFETRRSFTPLQKYCLNHRSYVWTETLPGIMFASTQELSGIVWIKPCCSWINSVIQVLSNMVLQLNLVNRFKAAVSRQSSSFCLILQITRLQSLWNLK